jgi:uncharacterized protein (TIGR02996 family)
MNDDAAFVRALKDNPKDDALRRVYADWLEERGDPRGEFLRLQGELEERATRLERLRRGIDPDWLAAVRRSMSRWLTLRTGRSIRLWEIRQFETYAGLFMGYPTRERNRAKVDALLRQEREREGRDPYLVPPRERPIEVPNPRGEPAELPAVACVAQFDSFQPAKDPHRDGSQLVVVWFQDEFAFPIAPAILDQLLAIDWNRHAVDFNF